MRGSYRNISLLSVGDRAVHAQQRGCPCGQPNNKANRYCSPYVDEKKSPLAAGNALRAGHSTQWTAVPAVRGVDERVALSRPPHSEVVAF
jgi:hypothetical protein